MGRADGIASAARQHGSDSELESWLAVAHELCDVADRACLDASRTELQVSAKDDGSFVTEADQAIERAIRERLADVFPDHGVVGEEYDDVAVDAATRWYVDPIDGTHNFMRGVPMYGTLLGVERDGELQVGVVSAPALGRRWWARRGGGAWVQDITARVSRRQIRVSTRDSISTATLLYRSILDMRGSRTGAGFETLLSAAWRERAFGDIWGYALVAEGAAEIMLERDLHVWDIAAPWVIVEEAGGRMSDFGGQRDWHAGEGFASNGLLHDQVLEWLHG